MLVRAHSVPSLTSGLSPMQERLLRSERFVRLVSAPTGSGKSYAFMRAVLEKEARVLFIVPTKRLLQNLIDDARSQAREWLQGRGWAEDRTEAWIAERILEWSGNQTANGGERLVATRVRQLLDAGASSGSGVIFAIPEVVVRMISGIRVTGAGSVSPFQYVRAFDHVVFDEFHTIEDRSFGLAALFSLLAVEEQQGKVSLLSATPVDVTGVLARMGVRSDDVAQIDEEVVEGHPPDNRPIHGDVALTLSRSCVAEAVGCHLEEVRVSIADGETVIVIYDSLARLKQEEPMIRSLLAGIGVRAERVLSINSLDDSERRPGEARRGRSYADPRDYEVLLCTSSVEVGVTFRSTLMFMDPGHRPESFVQRVGRVARGSDDGRVVVSIPDSCRNRRAWTRKVAEMIERADTVDVQAFTAELLSGARRRLEPTRKEMEADTLADGPAVQFYRRTSWRGAFWAALFVVAMRRREMEVQKGASSRLRRLSSKTVKFVDAKVMEILNVEEVDDCLPLRCQPHRAWIKALFRMAMAYRDIGATLVVVDPGGAEHTVGESFLRRTTNILDRYVEERRDGERIVRLMQRSLDEEIRARGGPRGANRLNLHVRSPIGEGSFAINVREHDKGTERLKVRLVKEWQRRFRCFIAVDGRGRSHLDPREKVMTAATALVERLGTPPLEEDYDDLEEDSDPAGVGGRT